MTSIYLEISLVTEASFTARSATVGTPRSLEYVPGAALLGACSAQAYDRLSASQAFDLFHSGAVRFGNGLPLVDGATAVPVPLSVHGQKRAPPDAPWFNLARSDERPKEQLEQKRGKWIAPNGASWMLVELDRTFTMRTAMNEEGQAREGFLYGLETLPAGARFLARVDSDDANCIEIVRDALVGREVRLGRSRGAEYGLARVAEIAPVRSPETSVPVQPGRVVLLCLSDLCLRDPATGQPTLDPNPSTLGLPADWVLDRERTFLHARRWSPFNGHRRRPATERQAIQAGSVITFNAPQADLSAVRATLSCGVGENRQDGLGQILVEPDLLRSSEIVVSQPAPTVRSEAPRPSDADGLVSWLESRQAEQLRRDEAWDVAESWSRDLAWSRLRSSQWGELRALARQAQGRPNSKTWLLERFEKDIAGRGVAKLQGSWGQKRKGSTLGASLAGMMREANAESLPVIVELLCTKMVQAKRKGGDDA